MHKLDLSSLSIISDHSLYQYLVHLPYLVPSPSQSSVHPACPQRKRNASSRLNKEIEEEVKAFTARSTGQPTDQDFLELENNVRELRVKYCKSGDSVTSRQNGDDRAASSSGHREDTPGSSKKVRGPENRDLLGAVLAFFYFTASTYFFRFLSVSSQQRAVFVTNNKNSTITPRRGRVGKAVPQVYRYLSEEPQVVWW